MNFNLKCLVFVLNFLILGSADFISAQLVQPVFKENAILISDYLIQNAIKPGVQTPEGIAFSRSMLLTPARDVEALKNRKNCLNHFVSMRDERFDQIRRDVSELHELSGNSFINEKMDEIYKTTQKLIENGSEANESNLLNIGSAQIGGRFKIIKDSFVHNFRRAKRFAGDIWNTIKNNKLTWVNKRDYLCGKTLPLYFSFIAVNTIYRWFAIDGFKYMSANGLIMSGVGALAFKYFLIAAVASLVGGYFAHKLSNGSVSVVNMISVFVCAVFDLINLIFKLPMIAVTRLSEFLRNILGDGWMGSNLMAGVYMVDLAKGLHPITNVRQAAAMLGRLICTGYSAGMNSVVEMKSLCSKKLIGAVDAFSGIAAISRESFKNEKLLPLNVVVADDGDKINIKKAWSFTDLNNSGSDFEFTGVLTREVTVQLMMYNGFGAVFGSSDSIVKFVDFNSTLYFNANGEVLPDDVNWENFGQRFVAALI